MPFLNSNKCTRFLFALLYVLIYASPCVSIESTDVDPWFWLTDIQPYLVITKKKLRVKLIIGIYNSVRYSKEMKKLKEEFYEKFMSI